MGALLARGAVKLVAATWIPSHLDLAKCESPFEEWIATRNGIAGSLAVCCSGCWRLRRSGMRDISACCRSSGSFTLPCLNETKPQNVLLRAFCLYSFLDTLSTAMDPEHFVQNLGYPVEFLQSLFEWLRAHEIHDQVAVPVSFLEITCGFEDCSGAVPFSKSRGWELDTHGSQVSIRKAHIDSFLWSHSQGVSVSLPALV